MRNLRNRFERFCYRHQNWGIPNLMLFIVIGCAIVSAMSLMGYPQIYDLLCFDRNAILGGQVWRLITYVFTMSSSGIFLTLLLLYCYYSLGRIMEMSWGTFRFNLYYFTGIILMDVFAMAFGGIEILDAEKQISYNFSYFYSGNMTSFLHLSLLLCFATQNPDNRFVVFFVIPIRAWILALIYIGVTLFQVINMSIPVMMFPHNLFPLIALANYFLFFGRDVVNVLPPKLRYKLQYRKPKVQKQTKQTGTIPFTKEASKKSRENYSHRCTVCGRTDVSNSELEFRYCSRCNGYFCYCQEHISNHTHIE